MRHAFLHMTTQLLFFIADHGHTPGPGHSRSTAAITLASAAATAAAAAAWRAFLAAALVLAMTAGLLVGFVGLAANDLLRAAAYEIESDTRKCSVWVRPGIWCAVAARLFKIVIAAVSRPGTVEGHGCEVSQTGELQDAPGKQRPPVPWSSGVCGCAASNEQGREKQERVESAPHHWC